MSWSRVTTGFHQCSCRWQNKYLKMFGASKAEGRENISWLRGIKLFFQKLLKCIYFSSFGWKSAVWRCVFIPSWSSCFRFTETGLGRSLCTDPRKEKKNHYWNMKAIIKRHKEYLVLLLWYDRQLPKNRSMWRWTMKSCFFPLGQSTVVVHSDLF